VHNLTGAQNSKGDKGLLAARMLGQSINANCNRPENFCHIFRPGLLESKPTSDGDSVVYQMMSHLTEQVFAEQKSLLASPEAASSILNDELDRRTKALVAAKQKPEEFNEESVRNMLLGIRQIAGCQSRAGAAAETFYVHQEKALR